MAAAAVNAVGFTSCITAAFRAVEQAAHGTQAIITDALAQHLGAPAQHIAQADWEALVAAQGPGKSLRVPARNRLLDDALLAGLAELAGQQPGGQQPRRVQVVNIGCGMDSKPWRLHMAAAPLEVHWYDVDQPAVLQLKQQLLAQAGAATSVDSGGGGAPRFPLLVSSYNAVAADLAATPLLDCLAAAGFSRELPTLWLAEALIYYLPLDAACQLLADMRAASAPGSRLVATVIDRELLVANHTTMDKGHYFAAMWHFCVDDLTADGGARLARAGWRADAPPRSTAELARERYGRATFVALYGGAECMLTARPV